MLHIPHSSRVVPREERKNLVLDDTDLNADWLFPLAALGACATDPYPYPPGPGPAPDSHAS